MTHIRVIPGPSNRAKPDTKTPPDTQAPMEKTPKRRLLLLSIPEDIDLEEFFNGAISAVDTISNRNEWTEEEKTIVQWLEEGNHLKTAKEDFETKLLPLIQNKDIEAIRNLLLKNP